MSENLISFSQDQFNRKLIAENLTKIIESKDKPMVISLDSDWGTGKTTFVTMWKDMLDTEDAYNDKFKTLYFNAWENDYIKDPLLAVFSEIESQIKEEDSELKKQLDKVKNKMKPIAKLTASTGAKILTAGMLNLEQIDLGNYNEAQLIELAGKLGDASIKELSASKNARAELKKELSKYQSDSNKKILFFIDELDRCRPSFAIELLEVIKHLFDIDNFIFIISIDKEQLSHSVSTIYGQGMDTVGYLRRFFDLDYRLPRIAIKQYVDIKNENIFENYTNTEYIKAFLEDLFRIENFSLRDIDKTYYYLELLLPLIKEFNESVTNYKKEFILSTSYIYSILIITKIKNPTLYKKVLSCDYKMDNILDNFKLPDFSEFNGYIGEYHPEPLQRVLDPILNMYLELHLKFNTPTNTRSIDRDAFVVGLRDKDGNIGYDKDFNLIRLFENKGMNIIQKLEFIDGF